MALTRTFVEQGDFAALHAAEDMARELGLSIGSHQRGAPTGLMFGDYDIAKWRNLSKAERTALHGIIHGFDKRNGPVCLTIYDDAPDSVCRRAMQMGAGVDTSVASPAA